MRGALLIAALALPGCAALGPQRPIIETRFARDDTSRPPDERAPLTFAVSSAPVPGIDGGIPLTALSDRGQAKLIEQTKGKPPTLLKPATAETPIVVLRNTLSRRLVIAIRPKGFLRPGDRVDAILVTLRVEPAQANNWTIASWTQAFNGQTVIDLGKLSDTATSKASVSAGLNLGPMIPSLSVGGETGRSLVRETEIRDTTEFDAAVDNDGTAWLYEVAGSRQSLAHNLSVDVVLNADKAALSPSTVVIARDLSVQDAMGKSRVANPSEVGLRLGAVYAPLRFEQAPVCGVAELSYRIRRIRGDGNRTYTEADDTVEFETYPAVPARFLLAPAPYTPNYVIQDGPNVLHYRVGAGRPGTLTFGSLGEATEFRNWLRQTTPPGGRLAAPFTIGFPTLDGQDVIPPTRSGYGRLDAQAESSAPETKTNPCGSGG